MNRHEVEITTHDRLMRAWENSMELTRDFQRYSQDIHEDEIAETFKDFAEDEAMHADRFRSLLVEHEKKNKTDSDKGFIF